MKAKVLIVAVLVVLVCSTAAWSQGRPGPRGPGMPCVMGVVMPPHGPTLDRLADVLQLTDDQLAKIKDLLIASEGTIRPLVQKAGEAVKAAREALFAADSDEAGVKALAAKAEKAEADVVNAGIDVWTKVKAILTADQLAGLKDAMTPPPGPRGPGGPGGPPPGGGPPPPPPGG